VEVAPSPKLHCQPVTDPSASVLLSVKVQVSSAQTDSKAGVGATLGVGPVPPPLPPSLLPQAATVSAAAASGIHVMLLLLGALGGGVFHCP
jgi:hypothetical protein